MKNIISVESFYFRIFKFACIFISMEKFSFCVQGKSRNGIFHDVKEMENEQTGGKPLFALELNYLRKIFKILFSVHSKNGKMSGFRLLFTFF